jgi:hypothetical protein
LGGARLTSSVSPSRSPHQLVVVYGIPALL